MRSLYRKMRWRNQVLALLCLTIFFALGVLYFRHWVVQKPFGIILFVGEGLTPDRIATTRLYAGGADARLTIDSFMARATLTNYSADFSVPDDAAAATAFATGRKVNNGSLSVDPQGDRLQSIIDLARGKGRSIGLVTDARLTNPTLAAFYAHSKSPPRDVAQQLASEMKVDIALGGGAPDFLPEGKGGARTDGHDLILELRRSGYEIVRTKAELESIPRWRRPRLLGFFNNGELPPAHQPIGEGQSVSLADMTRRAIELLEWNPGGYLLIVDASLMGAAARQNAGELTLMETLELDRAIATARNYSGENVTVIVTGNLGIGGLALNGSPFRRDRGVGLLGVNGAGEPALTWATGPNGWKNPAVFSEGTSSGTNNVMHAANSDEPAAAFAPLARNMAADVFAAARGPGSERLLGLLDNTFVFQLMRDEL